MDESAKRQAAEETSMTVEKEVYMTVGLDVRATTDTRSKHGILYSFHSFFQTSRRTANFER